MAQLPQFIDCSGKLTVVVENPEHLNAVTEVHADRFQLLALSQSGVWLPLFEVQVSQKLSETYRLPLLLKLRMLGADAPIE